MLSVLLSEADRTRIAKRVDEDEWEKWYRELRKKEATDQLKDAELQRHRDFYRCLNMSKGAYCE